MKRLRFAIYSFVIYAAVFAGLEYWARENFHQRPAKMVDDGWLGITAPHPRYLFWNKPGGFGTDVQGNPMRVNSIGLRGPEVAQEPAPNTLRILSLGESTSFGATVAESETYCARVEAMLNERLTTRRAECLNAGVPASTSFQAARYLEDEGLMLKPNVVFIYYLLNDHSPTIVTGPVVQQAIKTNVAGFGTGLRDSELAARRDAFGGLLQLLDKSAFYRFMRGYLLEEVHSFKETPNVIAPRRVNDDERVANLTRMIVASHKAGARVVLIVPGYREFGKRYSWTTWGDELRELAKKYETLLVDADAALDGYADAHAGDVPPFTRASLFNDSSHPNALGHEVIAAAIRDVLFAWLPEGM